MHATPGGITPPDHGEASRAVAGMRGRGQELGLPGPGQLHARLLLPTCCAALRRGSRSCPPWVCPTELAIVQTVSLAPSHSLEAPSPRTERASQRRVLPRNPSSMGSQSPAQLHAAATAVMQRGMALLMEQCGEARFGQLLKKR